MAPLYLGDKGIFEKKFDTVYKASNSGYIHVLHILGSLKFTEVIEIQI